MKPPVEGPGVDALFAQLLQAQASPVRIRETLERLAPDDPTLLAVLRRAVPVRFLELLAAAAPWSERPRILAGIVLNPRAPRTLSLKLLPALFWRDLADVAASFRLASAVRARAEGLLAEMLPQMRLGDRISLAKVATAPILPKLLADVDVKVVAASLENPRLTEEALIVALRQGQVSRLLIEQAGLARRWRGDYAVKLALVLQPRTPLALSLAQISSLVPKDLRQVAAAPGLPTLVKVAADRLAGEGRET